MFVRRQGSSGRTLHRAQQTYQGNHSSAGLTNQERLEGLAPGIPATSRFAGGLCGPGSQLLAGAAGGS
jgi:hypothetical protein